jgi:RimJ/RimL family protein N-acetyltransferase
MIDRPMPALRARLAAAADSADIFEWRNDEQTRAASRSSKPVARDQHDRWFADVLADELRRLYIVETTDKSEPVGMCRFDAEEGGTTEVSINLNPAFRGRGFSVAVLETAIETFRDGGRRPITATIRPSNSASIRLFEHAGFRLTESTPEFNTYLL